MLAHFLNRNTKIRTKNLNFCKKYSTKQANANQEYFKALEYFYDDQTFDNLSVVVPYSGRGQETLFNISNPSFTENSIVITGMK